MEREKNVLTNTRRNAFATLLVLSLVLVGLSLVQTASATNVNTQSTPPLTDSTFGHLPNGVYYKVINISSSFPFENATGIDVEYKLFLFQGHVYAVKVSNAWGLNITGKVWYYRVVLVSNPDGSAKVDGDEVRVTTTAILINGTYSIMQDRTVTVYNITASTLASKTPLSNSSVSSLVKKIQGALVNATSEHKLLLALALGGDLSLLHSDNAPVFNSSVPFAYFNYEVAQDFFPYFNSTMSGTEADMMMIRNDLMGLIVYNDTNNNGIMDLTYSLQTDTSTGQSYYGLTSSEAMYVFKPTSVHGVGSDWGAIPVYNSTTKSVDWSITISGVNGTLAPVGAGIAPVKTQIDQVKFAFHFVRPNNGTESGVKVDEHFGTFANVAGNPTFSKLSLAVTYYSYVENFQLARYRLSETTASGAAVTSEGNSTTQQNNVTIFGSGIKAGYIRIGGDTYIWGFNNSTQTANSNIVPWFFFKDQFSVVGNDTLTTVALSKFTYFYEACFPEWGGYSITHDPYFATYSYSATPAPGALPITLIATGVGIGALVAIAAILVRRRRSAA
jgi:hypothetical protein